MNWSDVDEIEEPTACLHLFPVRSSIYEHLVLASSLIIIFSFRPHPWPPFPFGLNPNRNRITDSIISFTYTTYTPLL